MTASTPVTQSSRAFRAARDLLLTHRDDYEAARREFAWPDLGEFNWALDWFDVIAAEHPERPALRIVGDDAASLTYGELKARSGQVANWLRGLGVRRGDRVLLMLGNVAPLWEVILGAMKLGAVIIPASTLLQPADLDDRVARGQVGHVVTDTAQVEKFANVPGDWTRVVVGGAAEGWHSYADAFSAAPEFTPEGVTRASDPLLLYFTSGTTALPKLVAHTQVSYPVGHLSTMYWVGIQPGDVHLNLSSPGWAKHAWSNLFAPWNAGATVLVLNYPRFSAASLLAALGDCRDKHVLRAAHGVADADPGRPGVGRHLVAARVRGRRRAAQPRGDRAGAQGLGDHGAGRVRPDRDDGPGRQHARPGGPGRLDGTAAARVRGGAGRPAVRRGSGRDGEICLDLSRRPLGLMTGYLDDDALNDRAMAGGYYHTGDVATSDDDGYITYVGRTDDIFKASDYRISPFELESILIEHEAVAEAAVVPSPDPVRLAVPKAYVLLTSGRSPSPELAQEIMMFCRQRVAPYKRIRRLEFADLPKTISGKIRRVELRDAETGRPSSPRGVTEFWEEDFSW